MPPRKPTENWSESYKRSLHQTQDGSIEVHGAAQTNAVLCLVTDNCAFNCTVANGGNSISLLGTGVSLISSAGWIGDLTGGPVAASGLNDINTQLQGRTGPWVTLSTAPPLGSGWSGTVSYRINGDGRVEFVGAISGPTGTTAFTLPAGYRPANAATLLGLMGSGVGSIAVSTLGVVTPTGTTAGGVAFDGLSLPVR
jgi:hypothetical protein